MAFDVNQARAAGYSDEEILGHLTQSRKFDIEGARSTGYSDEEMIDYLSKSPKTPVAPKAVAPLDTGAVVEGIERQPERSFEEPAPKELLQPGPEKNMSSAMYRAGTMSAITLPETIKNFGYAMQARAMQQEEIELNFRKKHNPNADWSRLDQDLARRKALVEERYEKNRPALDVARDYIKDATPEDASIVQDAAISVASNIPTLLGAGLVAPYSIPAAVTAGVGVGMVQQGSSTVLEIKDRGGTLADAGGPALVEGFLEGAGEAVGLPKVFSASKGGFRKLAQAMGYEGGQEAVTQFMQDMVAKLDYKPELTWQEMGRNAAVAYLAGAGGAPVGTAAAGIVPGTLGTVEELIKPQAVRDAEANLDSISARLQGLRDKRAELEQTLTLYGQEPVEPFDGDKQPLIDELDQVRGDVLGGVKVDTFLNHPNQEIAQAAKAALATRYVNKALESVFFDQLDAIQKELIANQQGFPFYISKSNPSLNPPTNDVRPHFELVLGQRLDGTAIKGFDWYDNANESVMIRQRMFDGATPEQQENLRQLVKVVDSWREKFMPEARIIYDRVDEINDPQTQGSIARVSQDLTRYQIAVKMSNLAKQDISAALETMAHEFGHLMMGAFYEQSPPNIQQALFRAWREDVAQAVKNNETVHQFGVRTAGMISSNSPLRYPSGTLLENATDPFGAKWARYYANFAEWTAHQMERALDGDFQGMQDAVRQYIKNALTRLKQFFNLAIKPIQPSMTFREFVEYHLTDRAIRNMEAREAEARVELATAKLQRSDMAMASLDFEALKDLIIPGDESSGPLDPPAPNGMTRRVRSVWRNLFGKRPDDSGMLGDLDKFSRLKQLTASLLYIAKQNAHIPQLYNPLGTADPVTGRVTQGYVDYVEQWHNARMKQMAQANDTLKLWRKLSQADQERLSKFMLDQTLEGKFFNPLDPAVIKKYDLNDTTLEMFARLKADFTAIIDHLEAALIEEVQVRLIGNPILPSQIREIQERFNLLRSKPYFPLSRFGKYVVLVRAGRDVTIDGKNYTKGQVIYREHFDSKVERASQMDAIRGAWRGHEVKEDLVAEAAAGYTTVPREILEAMKDKLQLTDEQRAELDRYLLELAPARSFSKHLMQRRGIAGFSLDLQRAYAAYMVTASNYVAKIRYAQPLRESINSLHATANTITGDSSTRRAIANYMARHYEYIMAPEQEWAAIRATIAVSYLGFMVKSAFVNLLQTPMVTLPHLAAIHGEAKAIAELGKAYSDVRRMYEQLRPLNETEQKIAEKWLQADQLNPQEQAFIEKWTGFKIDEYDSLNRWLSERSALQEAKSQGFIDEALAMELVGMSNGGWLSRMTATNSLSRAARTFSHVAMMPFEMAERMNRRVTFLAAYRLAKQSGLTENRAFVQAKEAVRISQFEYARYNRPELLRGRKGILMMFMQYQLSMLYFLSGGDKGWWRAMIGQLLVGGLLGLPFMQNIIDIIDTVATKLHPNDKFDAKAEAKAFLENISESPDIFLHGISRYGFGLLPWVDLSGSVSMGRIIPGTDVIKHMSQGQDWDSAATDLVTEVGGATSSLAMRMMQAAASNDPDLWKRVERGMPFTAGQQVMTALRWWNRGAETDMKGASVKDFDPNDPYEMAEIIGKGLGFNPRSVVQAREDLRLKQDFLQYYMIRRGLLLKALDFAKETQGSEQVREAVDQIHTYNREVPFKSMAIRAADLQRSIKQREKGRAMQEAAGATSRRGAQFMNELP